MYSCWMCTAFEVVCGISIFLGEIIGGFRCNWFITTSGIMCFVIYGITFFISHLHPQIFF